MPDENEQYPGFQWIGDMPYFGGKTVIRIPNDQGYTNYLKEKLIARDAQIEFLFKDLSTVKRERNAFAIVLVSVAVALIACLAIK